MVSVGVGGAAQLGTTGSDGSVTVKMPVVADPGSYQITAAFAGDEVFQPSSASTPLAINRAAVTPTVLPAGAASAGINISGALGGNAAGLQQVPVAFTVNGPSGTTTVYAITDYLGNAIFPPPSGLPAGNYTVTQATFGGDGTYAPTTITFATPLQVSVPKTNQSITFGALARQDLRRCGLRAVRRRELGPRRFVRRERRLHGRGKHRPPDGHRKLHDHRRPGRRRELQRRRDGDAELLDRRAGHGADRGVAGARRAESDDGRHRHVHADVQRSGHGRHGEQFRGRARAASPGRRSPRSAGRARRGR